MAQTLAQPDESLAMETGGLLEMVGRAPRTWGGRHHALSVGVTLLLGSAFAKAMQGLAPGVHADSRASSELMRADEEKESCSWEGESCFETKCCRRTGLKCWEKTEGWASCSASCGELKAFGGNWSCKELGGDQALAPIVPGSEELPYQSLFCFMVVTAGGVVPPGVEAGYEQLLVQDMKKAKASIFSCDGSAVYDGLKSDVGEWKSIKNTDIFAQVWGTVRDSGEYKEHSWTVKVDADAVFFPDRLRLKLSKYIKPPTQTPLFFKNIDFKFNFMGALEVMSKEAADVFIAGLPECLEHIGADGGEDIFTMQCLEALGVPHMDDYSLLKDKYANPDALNLFDVDDCDDDTIAAFHPYKAVNSWMGCWKVASHIVQKSQFTSCEHRWEGEGCSMSSQLDHQGMVEPGTGIVA